MTWAAWLTVLIAGAMGAFGAPERLRFTRQIELPEAGLAFRLPPGSVPDSVPPPTIVPGQLMRSDGVSEKFEAQDPLEVWRWKQREGRWVDERGNRVSLAAPSLAPPPFGAAWMERARVEQAIQALEEPTRNWGAPELARWLEAFWGVAGLTGEPIRRGRPFVLSELILFRALLRGGTGLAAAFKLTAEPERWRLALIELTPGMDADEAEKALRDDFAASLKRLARRTRETVAPAAAPADSVTDALAVSRLRVREGIRNMQGWWCAEGTNTIVLSNIRSGKSQLVSAILEDLETLRPFWEARIPPRAPVREVAVVRVFGTEEEYLRYVGPAQAWTAGLWMPMRQELVIRPVEEGSMARRRQAVLSTVYHEAFHQYLDGAFGQVEVAPWFNEGYATLFASVRISGLRVRLEKEAGMAGLLKQMSREGRADPGRILALDYPEFYAASDSARREHYALAWGLLYFLQAEEKNRGADPYRAIPARYREALLAGCDAAAATESAFEGVDRAALKEAFEAYWK